MKLTDSSGGANHVVPFSNGALRPPHVKRIGPAFPLFLLLEDLVTSGEHTDGIVLGGRPVTDAELGRRLGLHRKSVGEMRRRLSAYGYIAGKRTGRGYILRVRKSKKWAWLQTPRWSQLATSEGRDGAKPGYQMEPNRDVRPPTLATSRSDISLQQHKTTPYPGFEAFWKAYPRQVAKQDALKAWRKIKPDELSVILKGVEAWKRDEQWAKDGGKYIPYPATFLNGRRWEDVFGVSAEPAQAAGLPKATDNELPEWSDGKRRERTAIPS